MTVGTTAGSLGASLLSDGRTRFLVWAPGAKRLSVHLLGRELLGHNERRIKMSPLENGYFEIVAEAPEGTLYLYELDSRTERPDPASRSQPQGVHGPAEVIAPDFQWSDQDWRGLPLDEYLIYELHVGTFTAEGTFSAVIEHLDELARLGITAVEVMPIAQFAGARNWGYDGVYPYAVQNSYGGLRAFKQLVDACHSRGMALVLDVVYNHLGPEGNYLSEFGPYFTDRYRTPWGQAINFDGPQSDEVRRYFIENALYWVTECHVDGLRLDAVHAIFDQSAKPFLRELAEAIHQRAAGMSRHVAVIAESNRNDPRLVRRTEFGGYGLDGQWLDDFQRALHALLTGERQGYFRDFGRVADLAKAYREGFVLTGQHSKYRGRSYGQHSRDVPPHRFVSFIQNHDQVGNRWLGERLSQLVTFEQLKLAASTVLLSPYIPLIFMGEEYGETAPFYYFVSHPNPKLCEAVFQGRLRDFAGIAQPELPPRPAEEVTFQRSRPNHGLKQQGRHSVIWRLYQELLRLRMETPALLAASRAESDTLVVHDRLLVSRRWHSESEACVLMNFSHESLSLATDELGLAGGWHTAFDSSRELWQGPGSQLPAAFCFPAALTIGPSTCALLVRGGDSKLNVVQQNSSAAQSCTDGRED